MVTFFCFFKKSRQKRKNSKKEKYAKQRNHKIVYNDFLLLFRRLNSINEITENDLIEISQIKIVDLGKNRIHGWPMVNFHNFNNTKLMSL